MRHKKPILLLLILAFGIQLYAQKEALIQHIDSVLTESSAHVDNDSLLKRMYANTPTDTLARKVKGLKPGFETSYSNDEEFNYHDSNQTYNFWTQLKKRITAFLKKLFGYAPDAPNPDILSIVLKILSALVVLGVLGVIIRIYLRNNNRKFLNKGTNTLNIDINDSESLMQLANFETLIAENADRKAYRICVRLYFLWLLKVLKEQNAIQWLPDKTNSAYASELKESSTQHEFNYLAYVYEYVWYGEFTLTESDYLKAKQAFDNFIQKEVKHG